MSNLLDDLAFKYGADKTPRIKHHYTDVYFDLFKDKIDEVFKVLEIGTAEGASLKMWREFFPNAQIFGAEVDLKRVGLMKDEDRIAVIQCDQSLMNDLSGIIEYTGVGIDLVVDDGSHNPTDQIFTCLALMPYLANRTTYIIEDVDDASADAIKQILETKYSVDVRHVGKRHDDRLIIVRHKNG